MEVVFDHPAANLILEISFNPNLRGKVIGSKAWVPAMIVSPMRP